MIVLDTHAWVWWVSTPANLSRAAKRHITAAPRIAISAISCLEVATAVAKGRMSLDRGTLDWIEEALALPRVELVPLTPRIAVKAAQLGRDFHGDPADRIIIATAVLESALLITKDRRIRDCPSVTSAW